MGSDNCWQPTVDGVTLSGQRTITRGGALLYDSLLWLLGKLDLVVLRTLACGDSMHGCWLYFAVVLAFGT
jgi:hypothetical protein